MDQNLGDTDLKPPLALPSAALAPVSNSARPRGDELEPQSLYPLNTAIEEHLGTYSAFYE